MDDPIQHLIGAITKENFGLALALYFWWRLDKLAREALSQMAANSQAMRKLARKIKGTDDDDDDA
ncbi:hypothetical protein ACFOGJ_08770 [Marinibaculum pumilum]|uniref:Uncharacterized protein n=1 Tax=Marinibaculum pumilum TaxID=1766165 RepID=A0ABV7KYN6_9PROT